jgi:hypothetical protein
MYNETDVLTPEELETLDDNYGITAEEAEDIADGV